MNARASAPSRAAHQMTVHGHREWVDEQGAGRDGEQASGLAPSR